MKNPWFSPCGILYCPTTWQGTCVTALFGVFCVQVFIAIDRQSHSVSDTLFGIFPYVVPAFLLLNWGASKKSSH